MEITRITFFVDMDKCCKVWYAESGDSMENRKHSFKDTLKENLALAVYNTGYEICDGGYKWGPGVRDHYLLHYIRSGKGRYTVAGRDYFLGAGDLFLITPATPVSYAADEAEPWEYCWVGFNGTEARRMLQETDLSEKTPVLHPENATALEECLLNIYRSRGNTPAADAQMAGRLYLFLAQLMQCAHRQLPPPGMQDYLTQALRYIQHNYASNLQIQSIASYVGVSRSQLYRAFMTHLEVSPHVFLKRYRINEACTLLRNTRLSVGEIANSVGFPDPLYFSRVFKELKGVTPTEFQQSGKGEITG